MAKRKAETNESSTDKTKLIEALKFALNASDKADATPGYACIHDNYLTMSNETFSIGVFVDVVMDICPQAELLKAALEQCDSTFQLTQINESSFSVKSSKFRAVVPSIDPGLIRPVIPDENVAVINNALRDAFECCGQYCSSRLDRIIHECVLLRANTVVATNGGIAVEYWHGIDLPGRLTIPRKTVDIITKITKPLTGFGFSPDSVTFYFEDFSFVKTKLIAGEYPDTDKLFSANTTAELIPIWPDFFTGLKAISKFIKDDTVFFENNAVHSAYASADGASYAVLGLPGGFGFSSAYWRSIEKYATHVMATLVHTGPVFFTGKNIRGLMMEKRV